MTIGYVGQSPQERFLQRYNPNTESMGMSMDTDFGYEGQAGQVSAYNQQNQYGLNGGNRNYGNYGNYGGGYDSYQNTSTARGMYGVGQRVHGESQSAYNKRVEDFEDAQFERQIQLQLKNQNLPLRLQAPQEVIMDKVTMLASQINRGEQDKIAPAFNALVVAIKDKYMVNGKTPAGMSDAKLTQIAQSEARKTYAQVTGLNLADDIDAKGSNAFWQGMKKILSFGLADNKCAAENIAHVEGDTVNKSTKAGKILGGFSVAGVLGVLLVAAAKGKIKTLKLKP